ncbi:ABC transporter substrate-binding protein [Lysinibacter cavernae]|uniref:Putative ABC transport system substrate-binding protein n=1 Tax=Lysinibacter cavernae TaxID=1640652 RepID=A0A7X5R1F4_9MICO|nr:ABC transporter substrate-binding protein [Lysinibacter cavernae]NIH53925.1 putative ABC transport system substrate-binding protein [Lysinibacter cavernae]
MSVAALGVVSALALSGCSSDNSDDKSSDSSAKDSITIGISQYVTHPSLDATAVGFKKALEDAGYVEGETVTYDEQNAQADQATVTTISGNMADSDLDLVLAIATPSAQAAAQSITNIPVLFTAVTDAVEAGLVESNDKPGSNVTGTSDLTPVAEQFDLIREILPDAKKVGIIYSSGEVNSEIQVDLAKEAAKDLGITISEAVISDASEITNAVDGLKDVDAIYVPTDNKVVAGIEAVVKFSEDNKIPLFAGDAATVERGAAATTGINYEDLGYQTGEMAVRILKDGADPATMPVEVLSKTTLSINPEAAERMGFTIPEAVVSRADETY